MIPHIRSVVDRFAREVDYLEVRVEETRSTGIGFKGNRLDALQESIGRGGCVRALCKGGWGFASFTDLDRLADHAASAVKQAQLTGTDVSRLAPVEPVKAVVRPELGQDPREVPLARKIEVLKGYNDLILGFDPERIPTSSVSYGDTWRRIVLVTSEGTEVDQERIDIGLGLIPIAVRNGQTEMAIAGTGSSHSFEAIHGLEEDVLEACRVSAQLLEAPPIRGGTYTVIADPKMAGTFIHEAFGHTSEAEKVYENPRLAEVMKIGVPFGSEILSVYDTGLTAGSRGALQYDEEGVPTERTYLIQDGRLTGRLHTRETAGKMGEQATGNARAISYKFPPIPRMRNTCIAGGKTSFEEMIRDVKLGVYAVDAFGGQGGEMFTFTANRGYMIRDGRIEEMVKDVTLSGNLFTTLKSIDRVGDDFQQIEAGGGCGKGAQFPLPVADGSPHIRIQDVVIGGM